MVSMTELERTFSGLGRYISPKKNEELVLISTGNSRYVIGIREKGHGGHLTITNHLTKKEMQELIWDYTSLLSKISMGILRLK